MRQIHIRVVGWRSARLAAAAILGAATVVAALSGGRGGLLVAALAPVAAFSVRHDCLVGAVFERDRWLVGKFGLWIRGIGLAFGSVGSEDGTIVGWAGDIYLAVGIPLFGYCHG